MLFIFEYCIEHDCNFTTREHLIVHKYGLEGAGNATDQPLESDVLPLHGHADTP